MELDGEEGHGIVIVGGGICGLATALALHRKGIRTIVLERSETLRASGAAIGLWANAWRVLDQLGVGMDLRDKAILLKELRDQLHKNFKRTTPVSHEFRCVLRKDLVETLAAKLPPATIRFGCHVVGVTSDPVTGTNTLQFKDGGTMKAKVVIGCDGSNSAVARYLGLPTATVYPGLSMATVYPLWVIRGFTSYAGGHDAGDYFLRLRGSRSLFGRIPINETIVHFFIGMPTASIDPEIRRDEQQIRELALEEAKQFPSDVVEIVKQCDVESLSLTQVAYREPWHLINAGKFQRGTVTVAGDAMHVMGPFLGQGGASGMEDAIVLARHLAQAMPGGDERLLLDRVGAAQRKYVQERRARVMWLSTKSYLAGAAISARSAVLKMLLLAVMVVFFGPISDLRHVHYDCGEL